MTLKQKREIIERFLAGESINSVGLYLRRGGVREKHERFKDSEIEQVIRDYKNGKFDLERKPTGKGIRA